MHHRDSHQGKRRGRLARAAKCVVETLEKRQLLASDVFNINKLPVYTPTSGDINDFKNGPLGNVGTQLGSLYIDYKKFVNKGGKPSQFAADADSQIAFKGKLVSVSMRVRSTVEDATDYIRGMGGEIIIRSKMYRVIDAYVPVSMISTIADDSRIATVSANRRAITKQQGQANNQADQGLNADSLRQALQLTGDGIKIGVVSDSVNAVGGGLADSFASGDLPPPSDIDVLEDGSGTDEGRAMLELIHDIAPKASLAFATSTDTQLGFATNIRRLFDAGCDVIVDDVGLPDEPIFQEGIISQAITNVTEDGAVFVSAASNFGGAGFQDVGRWVDGPDRRVFMDWDPSERVDTHLLVDVESGGTFEFFWDNPFNGIAGAATTDLDVTFTDPISGQIVAQGRENNLATGIPKEEIPVPPGTWNMEVWIDNIQEGTERPRRLGFYVAGDPSNLQDIEYVGKSRFTAWGHSSGADTFSVAAVPFFETPAFDTDGIIETEDFTSYGPPTYIFKMNGERRAQPINLLKPDVSGVDNVNTSFFGGSDVGQDPDRFPNFSGTSAAAPNVAATAALLLQFAKLRGIAFTPDTIKNALIESAKLQPTNGADPGDWDRRGGFGLADGLQAARFLEPNIPIPDIIAPTPDNSARGIDSVRIEFSEPVNGFDLSDLTLTRSGQSVSLSDATLTTDDNQNFVLGNLKKITQRRGTYKLLFSGATVTDADTNLSLDAGELFYISGKPTNVVVTAISPSELNVTWFDNAVGEQGYRVYRSRSAGFSDSEVFDLGPNVTKLRDTGLEPATRYYYKVLPVYQDVEIESLPSTTVDGFTLAANEIVLDNLSSKGVSIEGDWKSIASGNKWGINYLSDNGTGKGDKSVTFTPNIVQSGEYLVYIRWTADDNRSTKVPVTVSSSGGSRQTTNVNQRQNTTWKLIGKFVFDKGRKGYVQINTGGTKGIVVADAARFVKADNGDAPPIDSGTTFN